MRATAGFRSIVLIPNCARGINAGDLEYILKLLHEKERRILTRSSFPFRSGMGYLAFDTLFSCQGARLLVGPAKDHPQAFDTTTRCFHSVQRQDASTPFISTLHLESIKRSRANARFRIEGVFRLSGIERSQTSTRATLLTQMAHVSGNSISCRLFLPDEFFAYQQERTEL